MLAIVVYCATVINIFNVRDASASYDSSDCFTWKINKKHELVLSCKLYDANTNVKIYDSKELHTIMCPNENNMLTCEANSNEKNDTTFTLIVKNNYEDQWFCEHRNTKLSANISISEGFFSSTQLRMSGMVNRDNSYTLSCSSCWETQGMSVHFMVNNNQSEDFVRFSNNNCFHKNNLCKKSQCSCSSNTFNWTFVAKNTSEIHNFTCSAEFEDIARDCGQRQTISLKVHGKDFKTDLLQSFPRGQCKNISISKSNNTDSSETIIKLIPNCTDQTNKNNHFDNSCKDYQIEIIGLGILCGVLFLMFLSAAILAGKFYQDLKTPKCKRDTNTELAETTPFRANKEGEDKLANM